MIFPNNYYLEAVSVTLTSYLTILLFLAPPIFLLFRYRRKPPEKRPGKAEVAGILTSAALMTAALVYMMMRRIFF